ncbi:MAG: phage terminase large subunit [Alphaproteobacteria bacterium]|nr:phage terminase large subunit [Alphaproteobacteria bacterium]
MKEADFKLFVVLWNQQQNQKTPDIHLQMAHWLEQRWKSDDRRMLLMAFRSAGKSTLVGLFCAWLLYRDQNLRILVLAADFTLAKKMVRNVKRIIEKHPLTKTMKPNNADQWASDRFTVKRMLELRDPSMMAKGVTSNITGSRADVVICDDVEVPNTCDSAEKRENLRERLAEIPYVLTVDGTQLYVGTPHDYYSIYADTPREEIGEERVFLDDFARLSIPILDENGESNWPEKYSPAEIAQKKIDAGPNKFASQMMLQAVNIMEGRLNPDLLQFYDAPVEYAREINTLFIGHQKMVGASSWWDPAFGKANGDGSVVAVVYGDQGGNYYLHHVAYLQVSDLSEEDEATQQCKMVAQIAKDHFLPSLCLEKNGVGIFLPKILRNMMSKENVPCDVRDVVNSKNKAVRILEAFDGLMAAQRLYVHKDVTKTPFLMEMREWRPGSKGCKDDGLDAVAGALSQQPDRLERIYGRGKFNWVKNNNTHRGKSDFDV